MMQKAIYFFAFIVILHRLVRHSEQTGIKHKLIIQVKAKKKRNIQNKFQLIMYGTHQILQAALKLIYGQRDKNDNKEVAMRENESLYMDSTICKTDWRF